MLTVAVKEFRRKSVSFC